jgi:hypothetical protein
VLDVTSRDGSDYQPGDLLDRAISTMREPAAISPGFDSLLRERLLAESPPRLTAATAPAGAVRGSVWGWLVRPRAMHVRPLALGAGIGAAMAVAAGLVAVLPRTSAAPRPASLSPVSSGVPTSPLSPTVEVRFVLVAPGAHRVSVLGDFNHWNAEATPLALTPGTSSTWITSVPLEPGRHVYAFMVDGSRWVIDPTAPRSLDDDFGRPSAVLTVAAGAT